MSVTLNLSKTLMLNRSPLNARDCTEEYIIFLILNFALLPANLAFKKVVAEKIM